MSDSMMAKTTSSSSKLQISSNEPMTPTTPSSKLQMAGMFAMSPASKHLSGYSSPKLRPCSPAADSPNNGSNTTTQGFFKQSNLRIQQQISEEGSSPLVNVNNSQATNILKLKNLVHRRITVVKMDDLAVSLRDFESGVTLGTGTFGRVRLIQQKLAQATRDNKPTSTPQKQTYFALKTMKKTDILRLKQVDHIMSEASLLKDLSHPFIVNLCATFQDSKRLYLILEYVPGGELFSYLRREKKISSDSARFYASEIVLALDYLHLRDIAYRDLKPENLLLSRSGHLKLTDFGFAKKIDGRTWTLCGTPEYLAPEIIQSKGHGKSVDWWALGILIYEMLAGYPPFYEENPLGIYQKILRGVIEWPTFFESQPREVISKLLKVDLTQRLGCMRNDADEVANEVWFSKVNWQSVLDRFIPAPFFPPIAHAGDTSNFDQYDEEEDESSLLDVKKDSGVIKPEDDARFKNFGPLKDEKDRLIFLGKIETTNHVIFKDKN